MDNNLWNKDLSLVPVDAINWKSFHFLAFWVSMSIDPTAFMLGGTLVQQGMSWFQATFTVFTGSVIVLIPFLLIGYIGTKYRLTFPVVLRTSFGVRGAEFAALSRAFVACGWFGIMSWLGGNAIFTILLVFMPFLKNIFLIKLLCYVLFCLAQIFFVHEGMEGIKKFEVYCMPILAITTLILLFYVIFKTGGSIKQVLAISTVHNTTEKAFSDIFFPSLTAVIGFWIAVTISITDFTRFAVKQKHQIIGQMLGMPLTMTIYCFIGIFVTSGTVLIFGRLIFDPVLIISKINNPLLVIILSIGIILALLTTNIVSNLLPRKINFKTGGYIALLLGCLVIPWKIIDSSSNYIDVWFSTYTPVITSILGIMICDFFIVRKRQLYVDQCFEKKGIYYYKNGWNYNAWLAFLISIIPLTVYILAYLHVKPFYYFLDFLSPVYKYSWFISFLISFILYWFFMKMNNIKKVFNLKRG